VLTGQYALPFWSGASVNGKIKYVHDADGRNKANPDDDYLGQEILVLVGATLQPTNELKLNGGYEYTRWNEVNRVGSQTGGFFTDKTYRHTARAGLTYVFGGANLSYQLEYFHKDLLRDHRAFYDQVWNVWRSKATFEVAW